MGKNVTCLLEPLTFELIRSTIWNVAVNAEEVTLPGYVFQPPGMVGCTETRYQQDNGFKKGPVPQLGWGRGINRTTVLKKAPSPSWAGGGVKLSTGQRF